MIRIISSFALAFCLSGCTVVNYFYPDKSLNYQTHKSLPELSFPEGIKVSSIQNAMIVPDIAEEFKNVPLPTSVDRPAPLKVGLMHLGIQKRSSGDRNWIYVDRSASQVWPELEKYFQDNAIQTTSTDPRKGLAESQWLNSSHDYLNKLLTDYRERDIKIDSSIEKLSAYRFLMSLQPGLQRNTSRLQLIVVTQESQQSNLQPNQQSNQLIEWPKSSDSLALEELLLEDVSLFLGKRLEQKASVSLLAQEMTRDFEADIVTEENSTVHLLVNQDFNQSWYLIGKAIREASMPLVDLNRSLGIFYLSTSHEDSENYSLTRLINTKQKLKALENHQDFQLALQELETGVEVRVKLNDQELADPAFAFFILETLREAISNSSK